MVVLLDLDNTGRVYYTIACDRCAQPFVCYDDGCYSYPCLRDEAVFAGWEAGKRLEQPHRCPACLAAAPPVTTPSPSRSRQPTGRPSPPSRAGMQADMDASQALPTVTTMNGTVTVTGEVDLATADQVMHQLCTALRSYSAGSTVTVDLGSMSFIDARGCTAFRAASQAARQRDITLRLVNAPAIVATILNLCDVPGVQLASHDHRGRRGGQP